MYGIVADVTGPEFEHVQRSFLLLRWKLVLIYSRRRALLLILKEENRFKSVFWPLQRISVFLIAHRTVKKVFLWVG